MTKFSSTPAFVGISFWQATADACDLTYIQSNQKKKASKGLSSTTRLPRLQRFIELFGDSRRIGSYARTIDCKKRDFIQSFYSACTTISVISIISVFFSFFIFSTIIPLIHFDLLCNYIEHKDLLCTEIFLYLLY